MAVLCRDYRRRLAISRWRAFFAFYATRKFTPRGINSAIERARGRGARALRYARRKINKKPRNSKDVSARYVIARLLSRDMRLHKAAINLSSPKLLINNDRR